MFLIIDVYLLWYNFIDGILLYPLILSCFEVVKFGLEISREKTFQVYRMVPDPIVNTILAMKYIQTTQRTITLSFNETGYSPQPCPGISKKNKISQENPQE